MIDGESAFSSKRSAYIPQPPAAGSRTNQRVVQSKARKTTEVAVGRPELGAVPEANRRDACVVNHRTDNLAAADEVREQREMFLRFAQQRTRRRREPSLKLRDGLLASGWRAPNARMGDDSEKLMNARPR